MLSGRVARSLLHLFYRALRCHIALRSLCDDVRALSRGTLLGLVVLLTASALSVNRKRPERLQCIACTALAAYCIGPAHPPGSSHDFASASAGHSRLRISASFQMGSFLRFRQTDELDPSIVQPIDPKPL